MDSGTYPKQGTIGVTVGKFNPPHLGHRDLVGTAAADVDHLYVILGDRPDQTISAERRRRWVEDAAPSNVTVIITPDDLPPENGPWARRALELLPASPDRAYTSEEWGDEWARMMGATHVPIDISRKRLQVSATQIRNAMGTHFCSLVPAARAELARRVVVIGAESTGKTTLAEAIAAELATVWVPEHGRWYWEGRRHLHDQGWEGDEFRRIAVAQRALEVDLARRAAHGVVVSDTDALVTAVWQQRYLGASGSDIPIAAPDLYILCAPDFDWVQDGTRESADQRIWMHEQMKSRAESTGASLVTVTGTHEERLGIALRAVRPLTRFPHFI